MKQDKTKQTNQPTTNQPTKQPTKQPNNTIKQPNDQQITQVKTKQKRNKRNPPPNKPINSPTHLAKNKQAAEWRRPFQKPPNLQMGIYKLNNQTLHLPGQSRSKSNACAMYKNSDTNRNFNSASRLERRCCSRSLICEQVFVVPTWNCAQKMPISLSGAKVSN